MQKHILLLSFGIVFFIGCGNPNKQAASSDSLKHSASTESISAGPTSGKGIGLVVRIPDDKKTVTLSHNDIPGIMEAMSMPYEVATPDLLRDIKQGDSVNFTLTKTNLGDFVVSAISKK